ncbi:SDR family NAD(P)-dependent oxidoreductase [Solilutibacter silvestris]|uniref:SDR family NAD(P)-dependent oxidoreductase n=1 Tax=Solilutibacter silvestris TaxID=1645665 RepID=UPI00197C9C9F|nr:SDR family oxidoreductase [Lysobacter silvestris]
MTNTSRRFEQRSVIVTGACGGIGLATARRFASEGARVALVDHGVDMRAAVAACSAAGASDVIAIDCDVATEHQVIDACAQVLQRFGAIDVVVNIAGMMVFKPLTELDRADWQRVLGVNLLGAAYFTRQALRHMGQGGAIVNVASVHARATTPLVAAYAASKAGLLSLTRSAAIEGKPLGIRANAILPGAVDTPMLWSNPNLKSGAETIAPEDVGTPDAIAAAIAFLASSDAAFVSGASLDVDGGRLAKL